MNKIKESSNLADALKRLNSIEDSTRVLNAIQKYDDVDEVIKLINKYDDIDKVIKGLEDFDNIDDLARYLKSGTKSTQKHHFLSNKNSNYTKKFNDIIDDYNLDLDGDWNKLDMPHQGRHPNAYHDYMLDEIKRIDEIADGNVDVFLSEFEKVKSKIANNPDMLYSDYWKNLLE